MFDPSGNKEVGTVKFVKNPVNIKQIISKEMFFSGKIFVRV